MKLRIYVLQLRGCEDAFHGRAAQTGIRPLILKHMLDEAENGELLVKTAAMMRLVLQDMAMISKKEEVRLVVIAATQPQSVTSLSLSHVTYVCTSFAKSPVLHHRAGLAQIIICIK